MPQPARIVHHSRFDVSRIEIRDFEPDRIWFDIGIPLRRLAGARAASRSPLYTDFKCASSSPCGSAMRRTYKLNMPRSGWAALSPQSYQGDLRRGYLRSRVVLLARGCTIHGCHSRPPEHVGLPGAASTTERPASSTESYFIGVPSWRAVPYRIPTYLR